MDHVKKKSAKQINDLYAASFTIVIYLFIYICILSAFGSDVRQTINIHSTTKWLRNRSKEFVAKVNKGRNKRINSTVTENICPGVQ